MVGDDSAPMAVKSSIWRPQDDGCNTLMAHVVADNVALAISTFPFLFSFLLKFWN